MLAKLTSENNKLHADLIALSSTSDARERRAQQVSKQQANEYADLKFVNSQLLHAMDQIKLRHEGDKRRMEDALQKHGIINNGSGDKGVDVEKVLAKLEKIDIETVLAMWTSYFKSLGTRTTRTCTREISTGRSCHLRPGPDGR